MGSIVRSGWLLTHDFFAPMGCKMFFLDRIPDRSYLFVTSFPVEFQLISVAKLRKINGFSGVKIC